MTYPNTGSILSGPNGTNKTSTGLSTNIIIKVGPNTVGAIQNISYDESRPISMITELGTDGVIDSAPEKSTTISGSCTRIRFDRMRIAEAFGRGFIHVKSQRVPFDIQIIDNWNGDGNGSLITTIKNVWINKLGATYSATEFIITDKMDWNAETIYTTLANGPAAGSGGERGMPIAIDSIEQNADSGGRRGSMDVPGLLKAFLPF
jgi:hypothetical protein